MFLYLAMDDGSAFHERFGTWSACFYGSALLALVAVEAGHAAAAAGRDLQRHAQALRHAGPVGQRGGGVGALGAMRQQAPGGDGLRRLRRQLAQALQESLVPLRVLLPGQIVVSYRGTFVRFGAQKPQNRARTPDQCSPL